MENISGQKTLVRGEVSTSNASSGVAFALYPARSTTSQALASTETLVITDYKVVSSAGGNAALTVNADSAGQRLSKGTYAANGGEAIRLETPFFCPIGTTPKLFAASGQVDAFISGYILTPR